jgi:hypothetical protein
MKTETRRGPLDAVAGRVGGPFGKADSAGEGTAIASEDEAIGKRPGGVDTVAARTRVVTGARVFFACVAYDADEVREVEDVGAPLAGTLTRTGRAKREPSGPNVIMGPIGAMPNGSPSARGELATVNVVGSSTAPRGTRTRAALP